MKNNAERARRDFWTKTNQNYQWERNLLRINCQIKASKMKNQQWKHRQLSAKYCWMKINELKINSESVVYRGPVVQKSNKDKNKMRTKIMN